MTQSLVLRFRAPLQAWGADSRYQSRRTHHAPTKSAVLGLLSAAEGRRRSDSVEDLVGLEFGVRVDQPGSILRDYQTAIDWRKGPPARLSDRYYLSDAQFLAALSGPGEVLETIHRALLAPRYPLYLGRRSCPAGPDLVVGLVDGNVEEALRRQPWVASRWHRKSRSRTVNLPLYRDARPDEAVEERVRDIPLSYDPKHREYAWRLVHAPEPVRIDNPEGRADDDPFWEAVIGA